MYFLSIYYFILMINFLSLSQVNDFKRFPWQIAVKINASHLQSSAFRFATTVSAGRSHRSLVISAHRVRIISGFGTNREQRVKRTTGLIRVNSRN